MLTLAQGMRERGETGSVLSLLCDSGDRYQATYFNPAWTQTHIGDVHSAQQRWTQALRG